MSMRVRTQASLTSSISRFGTDFESLGRLGKGGFGEVVQARNKLDGMMYAIKIIKVRWFTRICGVFPSVCV